MWVRRSRLWMGPPLWQAIIGELYEPQFRAIGYRLSTRAGGGVMACPLRPEPGAGYPAIVIRGRKRQLAEMERAMEELLALAATNPRAEPEDPNDVR